MVLGLARARRHFLPSAMRLSYGAYPTLGLDYDHFTAYLDLAERV